jgi:hypothetical protein
MKFITFIAHTTGGEVRSAPEQGTERDYEALKDGLKSIMSDLKYLEFNTDNGWVIIPASQLLYVEVEAN